MTVGGAFVYVCETCERGRVKDFEQLSRVYNEVHYNAVYIKRFFSRGPDDRVIMELQCILYMNIDQTLPNKSHGPTHCKIGDTCIYNGHVFYTLL